LLNPQPGETVLDVCAAPGGKSAALADRLGRAGRLVALEIHADRLARLRQNFTRLAWAEVRIAAADARYPASIREALASAGLPPAYDAVLLDVPCSNTGVLRRRADARWHFSADRLARLVKTQGQILDTAAGFVRPGGRLIYSTCSLEPEENEEQIRRWLERNPTFTLQESRALFPPDTGTDGAFCAWLQTKQETPA